MDILVLGVGNTWLSDEGVGVHVVKALLSPPNLPREGVEYVDGGTLSFTLAVPIQLAKALIVVDAAQLNAAPGTLRVFLGDEMGLPEAETMFKRALDYSLIFIEAHCNLGYTLFNQERREGAEASFRNALGLNPDFAEALHYLGRTLEQQCRFNEALTAYRSALKTKGDWKHALSRLTIPCCLFRT